MVALCREFCRVWEDFYRFEVIGIYGFLFHIFLVGFGCFWSMVGICKIGVVLNFLGFVFGG